jgi:HEAT repeat protein
MLFEEYLQELADPSSRVRASQLVRLSGLTGEQREQLAAVWPSIGQARRRQLMAELVELAEDNVDVNFDEVCFLGLGDPDAGVRLYAIRGLWEYERPDLIPPLVRLLKRDADAAVRGEVALALGRFVLLSEYGNLRRRYFEQVEAGLRCAIQNSAEMEEVRSRALEAMGPCPLPWVRDAIRAAYESDLPRLKVSAIHAMGRSCESRWLPLLLRELASDDAAIRYEAATACASLADERAVPRLAPLLEDPDPEVKGAAIAALGQISGSEAKALLLGLTADASPSVREAAQAALLEVDFGDDPLSFRYRV